MCHNAGAATGTDKYTYFIFLQGKRFKWAVQFLAHSVHKISLFTLIHIHANKDTKLS